MIKDSVNIKYGDWQAWICPRLGGNVVSLTYKGENVLNPLTDEAQLKVNPYLQGAPILIPANRTFKGEFVFEGKTYSLPINEPHFNCNLHGLVLFESFELVKASADSVTVRLTDTDAKSYPFPIEVLATYSLGDDGFTSEFEITNIGQGNMPLTFCTHTNFTEPEEFCVPISENQERDKNQIPTGRYIPLNEQERGYTVGSPSRGLYVSGYFKSCGNVARVGDYIYTVYGNYDHWVFYNGGGGKGYLCVEPQAGKVNGLNASDGHTVLKKGETERYKTVISRK